MTDWTSIAGLAVSVVAVGFTAASYRRDRTSTRAAAASAAAAEARADEAVAVQKRMAAALEAQQPPPAAVSWDLSHFQGDAFWLENTGDATAYEVHIGLGPGIRPVDRETYDVPELQGNAGHKFMASTGMTGGSRDVEVSWFDSPTASKRRTWTRPLPPRPPR